MIPKVAGGRRLGVLGWLGLALIGALLAWQLVAELVEPRLLLVVADWMRSKDPPLEVGTVGGTTLRLYADTRPHVGKIAGLQKGLVWVQGGEELVEEGYGFGCPIVVSGGRAYVSSHAETAIARGVNSVTLTKRYDMDTVDTPIRFLRRKFRRAPSLGIVTVRYEIRHDRTIGVAVDFSGLVGHWERAYLMNEQGARRFTHYRDATTAGLTARKIGIWELAGGQKACFDWTGGERSFCVDADVPARLYYGRERARQYNWRGIWSLSWSGVDLELPIPQSEYEYRITLY